MASALTAAVNKNVSFSPGRYHRASYQISYSLICSKIRLINNNLLPNRRNLYLFMWHSGTLNLLQGPMCCSIRNAFLHTLIVTGTYLTYCCLPVRSKQSGSSPLTSGINNAETPRELPLTGHVIGWLYICVNQQVNRYKSPPFPLPDTQDTSAVPFFLFYQVHYWVLKLFAGLFVVGKSSDASSGQILLVSTT